jgi:hypothetical protein
MRLWILLPICLAASDLRFFQAAPRTDLEAALTIVQADGDPFVKLAKDAPLSFLQACLNEYDKKVNDYTCTFHKFERGDDKGNFKSNGTEIIECAFREQPFSVLMRWKKGMSLTRSKVYYVKGENDNQVVGWAFLRELKKGLDDPMVKNSSRYGIHQFGFKQATERTLASMQKAKANGSLHVRFDGIVKVPQLLDRECYQFTRTPYDPPEEEGVNKLVLFFDKETLLQTGSRLFDTKGDLLAEYFFTDVVLNPGLDAKKFSVEELRK